MDLTTEAVRLGLHMSHLRAEVASQNIAGMNVPGARQKHVDFSAAIDALHQAETPDADPASLAATVIDRPTTTGTDASLDAEVADLATAGTDFQALSEALSRRFAMLELAMTGKS
jgi:flagellar basal body rod protein FlgB